MFFWNIDQTEPSKFDVDLDAKEEMKSDVKQDSKNIDVISEISSYHWIDIKKTCVDWSNPQIKIRIEKQVLGESWEEVRREEVRREEVRREEVRREEVRWEEVRWEDLQKQLENVKIEWCSDSSIVSLNDSINGTK